MRRHQSAIRRLMQLPYKRIPLREQWDRDVRNALGEYETGIGEIRIKDGIGLFSFGFEWQALPNESPNEFTVYPPGFPQHLFNGDSQQKKKVHTLIVPDDRFVFCQNWCERERLLELIIRPNLEPVKLYRYGAYFWCTDGTHRCAIARFLNRRLLAEIVHL